MENIVEVINNFLPEFVLLVIALINTVLSFIKKDISYKIFKWSSIIALLFAIGSLFFVQASGDYFYLLNRAFEVNVYTTFVKFLILLAFFLILLFSHHSIQLQGEKAPFYCNAMIISTLGAMLLVSSNNFISVLISLLMTNIGGILLAKYSQNEKIVSKYIGISLLALITYIIGASMLYVQFQEIDFERISEFVDAISINFNFVFASTLTICALCFQLFAFPFVVWKNQICKRMSYPALTFLSVIPLIAGFSILSRMMVFVFSYYDILKILLAIIAIISIFVGLMFGLKQENIKEIITSNVTIQSGIMLLGLSSFSVYSLSSVLFYLLCYSIAMIAFGASCTIIDKQNISAYKGLIYTRPYYAFATSLALLTLAGLAPTCGFLSKIYLLSAIARSNLIFMQFLIVAMFLMIGTIMFYFRLAAISFLRNEEVVEEFNYDKLAKFILYLCTVLIFVVAIYPEKLIELCLSIAYYI